MLLTRCRLALENASTVASITNSVERLKVPLCSRFLLFLLTPLLFPHVLSIHYDFDYPGKQDWDDYQDLCAKQHINITNHKYPYCVVFHANLNIRKVEIVSGDPIIFIYRQAVHRRQVKRIVKEAQQKEMENLMVTGPKEEGKVEDVKGRIRNANGTWIFHDETPTFSKLYSSLQRTLSWADISISERFQILSYNEGGHFLPHVDYLSEEQRKYYNFRSNRMMTVVLSLEAAKIGGALTFPLLGSTVKLLPGDFVVFFNIDGHHNQDRRALHASCPIHTGRKIGLTLWVHAEGNELRTPTLRNGHYNMWVLLDRH